VKVLAIILSTLIVLLSSFPCCQEEGTCDTASFVGTADNHESHDDDHSNNESPCSPFYNCGRCTGFTINYNFIEFDFLETDLENFEVPYVESLTHEVYFHDLKPPRPFEV
jgi:hypothetical protein